MGITPVIVVSAMGRYGNPYSTDSLVQLLNQPSDANYTLIASCGEVISASLFSNLLEQEGIPSKCITGLDSGVYTTNSKTASSILYVDPSHIQYHIQQGMIPVVAGFQGSSVYGEITTLSRGGSDTTAAALGHALHAQEIILYTDVPGIMTADPDIVKDAKIVTHLSYEAALLLASKGARVLHPEAVNWASKYQTPIKVTSFDNQTTDEGTFIGTLTNPCDKKITYSLTSKPFNKESSTVSIVIDPLSESVFFSNFLKKVLHQNHIYSLSCTHGSIEFQILTRLEKSIVSFLHEIIDKECIYHSHQHPLYI